MVLPFDNGTNTAPVSVLAKSAVQALILGMVALKQLTIVLHIMCLTWDEWSYLWLLLLWGLSDPRIAEPLLIQKKRVTGCLDMPGVNPLDIPRTLYRVSE